MKQEAKDKAAARDTDEDSDSEDGLLLLFHSTLSYGTILPFL